MLTFVYFLITYVFVLCDEILCSRAQSAPAPAPHALPLVAPPYTLPLVASPRLLVFLEKPNGALRAPFGRAAPSTRSLWSLPRAFGAPRAPFGRAAHDDLW